MPRRYVPDQAAFGMGGGTSIVRAARDRFAFYAFIVQFANGDAARSGGCLLRSYDVSQPSSWRAWDGTGFRHQFLDPYRSTVDPQHLCKPLIGEVLSSLVYSTYLKRWVLTSTQEEIGGTPGLETTTYVFVYRTSRDLVNWSDPLRILAGTRNDLGCRNPDRVAYPSLLDPTSTSRTFQTIGKRAYLYYTQFNRTMCGVGYGYDRDLVRVPVEFG
jgi:hypothetical protein